MTLEELFSRYPRIVVAGGPITGKSIVTDAVPDDRHVFHSDHYLRGDDENSFRESARTIVKLGNMLPRYVASGVVAHAALKYGLEADCVVLCEKYHGDKPMTLGQRRLKAQAETSARREAKRLGIPVLPFRGVNDFRWDGIKVAKG